MNLKHSTTLVISLLTLFATLTLPTQAQTPVTGLTTPAFNERVRANDFIRITWTGTPAGFITLHYLRMGDPNWFEIAKDLNGADLGYTWHVKPFPGPMRLRLIDEKTRDTVMGEQFTVVELSTTTPNVGTAWIAGSTRNITWASSTNALPYVKLEYTFNGSSATPIWIPIRDSVPVASGSFAWTVPDIETIAAKIRISEIGSPNVRHTGNEFTIVRTTGIRDESTPSAWGIRMHGDGTRVGFTLPTSAHVRLDVLNTRGAVVATPVNGPRSAGTHRVSLEAAKLPVGVYTLRLKVGSNEELRRIVVTR